MRLYDIAMRTLFGRVWLNGRGIIRIGGVNLRWSSELAGQDAPPTGPEMVSFALTGIGY